MPSRDREQSRGFEIANKRCESKSGSQFSGCNVSSRRPRPEDAAATPATLTISGRRADTSWLRLSRKQDRLKPEVGALPTPSSISAVCQNLTATSKERKSYATCYPLP